MGQFNNKNEKKRLNTTSIAQLTKTCIVICGVRDLNPDIPLILFERGEFAARLLDQNKIKKKNYMQGPSLNPATITKNVFFIYK